MPAGRHSVARPGRTGQKLDTLADGLCFAHPRPMPLTFRPARLTTLLSALCIASLPWVPAQASAAPAATTAAAPTPPAASATARVAAMDRYLRGVFKPEQPGAVVLVMHHGRPLLHRAYGLAHLELHVPMRPDAVFNVASVGKQFTAAVVLKLVEQGKLELGAPVSRYLPEAPAAWQGMTVEHLLSNTSGIANLFEDEAFRARAREDFSPEQLLAWVVAKPLIAAPGTRFAYASVNYNLLGLIVQRVSGRPFDEVVQQLLLAPLGLKHTWGLQHTGVIPGLVAPYVEGPLPAPFMSPSLGFAAAEFRTTAQDLATWTRALHRGQVLSAASVAAMSTSHRLPDGSDPHYGLGLRPHRFEGQPYLQSNGDILGFHAETVYLPQEDLFVAVLTNGEEAPVALDPLAKHLVRLTLGRPLTPPRGLPLSAAQRQALVGRYALGEWQREIRLDGDTLVSSVPGTPPARLVPLSATEFCFSDDPDARLRFVLRDGRAVSVERFTLERPPMAPPFPRVE